MYVIIKTQERDEYTPGPGKGAKASCAHKGQTEATGPFFPKNSRRSGGLSQHGGDATRHALAKPPIGYWLILTMAVCGMPSSRYSSPVERKPKPS